VKELKFQFSSVQFCRSVHALNHAVLEQNVLKAV